MDHEDPAFTDGAAYFVDNEEYSKYLKEMNQYDDIQEEVRFNCALDVLD